MIAPTPSTADIAAMARTSWASDGDELVDPIVPGETPAEIPNWSPEQLVATPSVLPTGFAASVIDAFRGVDEVGNGQPLSPVQIDLLSPFLATRYELPIETVASDLHDVRIYLGGPSGSNGSTAVALGDDIYVPDEYNLKRITSWRGRRWLSHELGHLMQWRQTEPEGSTDLDRTRQAITNYAGGLALNPNLSFGAVPRGVYRWVKDLIDRDDDDKGLNRHVHDAHRLEIEAQKHAVAFARKTARIAKKIAE